MMLARSLPTRTCFIRARRLASELSYQTRTRDLEKRVLRTGFRAPRRNHQVQSWHLLRPQRRRIEPEMADNEAQINEVSNGVVINSLGLKAVTEAPPGSYPRRDCPTRLLSVRIAWPAGWLPRSGLAAS